MTENVTLLISFAISPSPLAGEGRVRGVRELKSYFFKKGVNIMELFLYGLALVIVLGGIILFYYSKKRHKKVEEPKYRMLIDED